MPKKNEEQERYKNRLQTRIDGQIPIHFLAEYWLYKNRYNGT